MADLVQIVIELDALSVDIDVNASNVIQSQNLRSLVDYFVYITE